MVTEFTPFMRQLEERFRGASGLPDRSHYKIFYGQVKPAWILTLGINPGGTPAETLPDGKTHISGVPASSSATYFENDEHDVLDCEWKENDGLRRLLLPLLSGDLSRTRGEVVKTNLAFRRSAKASQLERERAFDEAAPFLNEIVRVVCPRLILLTGPSLSSFTDRFAKNVVVLRLPLKKEKVHQTVFAASKVQLRATSSEALVVQVAHASRWSATYAEYDVAGKILGLMRA